MTFRYGEKIKKVIDAFDPQGLNRYFLFGSAVRQEKFNDIDLAVVGNESSHKDLSTLRERFYNSDIPYKTDVIDFDMADKDFKDYVFKNESVVWIA